MKTNNAKQWEASAKAYAKMTGDKVADAYEYEINFPSILNLIPPEQEKGLDVGTGSGDLVPLLKKK